MIDWGAGTYELTAAQLAPAAEEVVAAAGLRRGDLVLDVGCGTGNGLLAAARRGASAVGVDPAPRLLEVAARRAREEGLEVEVRRGDALELPVEDGAFDAVLSVFGVIFAQPGRAAVRELLRAVRPGGRVVLSTWVFAGAIHETMQMARRAMAAAGAAPDGPPPFAWDDLGVLREAFAPHRVDVTEHRLGFRGASAAAFMDEQLEHHPLWLAGGATLAPDRLAELRDEMVARLAAENEDPAAFCVTSRYHVVVVTREVG